MYQQKINVEAGEIARSAEFTKQPPGWSNAVPVRRSQIHPQQSLRQAINEVNYIVNHLDFKSTKKISQVWPARIMTISGIYIIYIYTPNIP